MPSTTNVNETARYTLNMAGKEVSQAEPLGLEAISVEDHQDMIGMAELTFAGGLGMSWSSIKMDSPLDMNFGGDTFKVFSGLVVGMKHAYQNGRDTLTIRAMDPLCKLQASRKTKTFDKMKDSDMFSQIISEAGLQLGNVEATEEEHPYTFQRNESMLEFVRRLAARNGMVVRAMEGKIDMVKPQAMGSNSIPKTQLISLDYEMSPKALPKNTTVVGWDYNKKEKVEGKASAGDISTIGGGANAVSDAPTWIGDNYISDVYTGSQSMAKNMATAELNRMSRNFLKGRAVVQGNGRLHVGAGVDFQDHRPGFNASVMVNSSRHRVFQGSGHTTEIQFVSNTKPQ
ncbi:MAG: phage late control D family protein [Alphaproteobacteria bacterium]|nr:phage late control D family protein [Alphaproteobacteria bacterium]MCB9697798.1 phage late control D family protein [Alphaproteobacteria bacterium]